METAATPRALARNTVPAATGLFTDRYELSMLDSALTDGTATKRATFEIFARSAPAGATYGVIGGMDRVVTAIENFRFDDEAISWLVDERIVSTACIDYLRTYRFDGDVWGYRDGDIWLPFSPVLTIDADFGVGLILETLVLSILNNGCALASAASRLRDAAGPARLIEMGTRRTNDAAAVEAARLAWVGGFDATSNLAAGQRYGVPVAGTAAHAWILAHEDEQAAFETQIATHGVATTLLVDTYDIPTGIGRAVAAARKFAAPGPGAIRIDSGDLAVEARRGRAQLDCLGAFDTQIVVSGDLDEERVIALRAAGAPIDGFGIGTRYVATQPVGMVYKLVAIEAADGGMRPVAKKTNGKTGRGGRKAGWRGFAPDGALVKEVVTVGDILPPAGARRATVLLMTNGERTTEVAADPRTSTRAARARHEQVRATLTGPITAETLTAPVPTNSTEVPAMTPNRRQRRARRPRRALIITDLINDFIEGGSLAVAGGRNLARLVTDYLRVHRDDYDLVVLVRERHRDPGGHFASNLGVEPDFQDTWPDHGVDGTHGAEFPEELDMDVVRPDFVVFKGEYAASYDGFEGAAEDPDTGERTPLADILHNAGITETDQTGIAWDFCVKATALGSVAAGFKTRALADLSVAVFPERIAVVAAEMAVAGVEVVLSRNAIPVAA